MTRSPGSPATNGRERRVRCPGTGRGRGRSSQSWDWSCHPRAWRRRRAAVAQHACGCVPISKMRSLQATPHAFLLPRRGHLGKTRTQTEANEDERLRRHSCCKTEIPPPGSVFAAPRRTKSSLTHGAQLQFATRLDFPAVGQAYSGGYIPPWAMYRSTRSEDFAG